VTRIAVHGRLAEEPLAISSSKVEGKDILVAI
jgi:hypothetical protein